MTTTKKGVHSLEERAKQLAESDFRAMNWTEGDGTVRQAALYIKQFYLKRLKELQMKVG